MTVCSDKTGLVLVASQHACTHPSHTHSLLMKEDRASVRFFAIPELLHLLGLHLPIRELARLVSTNKVINATVTPILWRHVPPEMARRASHSPALSRRIHLIQSMDLSVTDQNVIRAITNAMETSVSLRRYRQDVQAGVSGSHSRMGLHSLTFVFDHSAILSTNMSYLKLQGIVWCRKINEHLVKLFQQTPFLTHLIVPSAMLEYEPRHLNSFLNAITFSLPRLQDFTMEMDTGHYVPLEASLAVVERCLELPNLVKLACMFEPEMTEEYTMGTADWEIAFSQTLFRLQSRPPHRRSDQLRTLWLPCTIWPMEFLVLFFKDCIHSLETLSVPFFDETMNGGQWKAEEVGEALRSSCPGIKNVIVPVYTQRYSRDDFLIVSVKTILEGCPSKDEVGAATGLQSLVLADGSLDWIHIGSALEPHLGTLQELVSHVGGQRFAGLGLLVQCCKNLKVLDMNRLYRKSGGYPLEWWPDRWVCHGLRRLCVQMEEPAHHLCPPPPKVARQKSWDHVVRFYKAIGRLEELEELTLGYGTAGIRTNISLTDLMLTTDKVEGCLGYLTQWRKLRHLRLMHDFWSRMGDPEIEFIAEHWPQLKKITFRTNDVNWLKTYLTDIYYWRKLKRLLPDLEYVLLSSGLSPLNYTAYN